MENKALQTLFLYNGIFVFAASLLGPLYAVFVETIDKSISSISLSWAAFLLSGTFFMLLVRKYGDRILETEYLLLAGFLVRAIAWFSFPFISTISMLILLQILLGLGEALGSPAYETLFAKHLDKNHNIEEYSDWKLIVNFSNAFAILLGGYIIEMYGFTPLFILMGGLALLSFMGILVKPRRLL